MDLKIREITKNEYPSFSPISDRIAHLCFSNTAGILLLAETETGCPIGYISAYITAYVTGVSYIFVRPLFRGRGVGAALFEKLIEVSEKPVSIDVVEGHPRKNILDALVKRFGLEVYLSASNYFVDMQEVASVHKRVCETRMNRIIDRLFAKGHTLKTFRECGREITDRLSDLIGKEFEGNTNPRLFKDYDDRYSFCLFKGDRPVAYSLVETNGEVAIFHLLSRAEHSYPGAFLVPLEKSFSALLDAGYKTLTFTVYKDNKKMRALSDFDFITEYVNRTRNYVSYVEPTEER